MIQEIIVYFSSISVITTGVVFLGKKILDTASKMTLEKYKNELKIELENEKNEIKKLYEKDNRKFEELKKWTNPVLSSVNGLIGRLDYFINKNGKKALLEDELEYNYYMPSSLYYFAQYLCWIQVLKEEINYEIFNEKKDEKDFFNAIHSVNVNLRSTAFMTPIYSLQQRQIAEMMISHENGKRICKSYYEFEENYKSEKFRLIIFPIEKLIQGINGEISNEEQLRAICSSLSELKKCCTKVLKNEI
ncbi:MAG: hypothetical protein PHN18_02965 [Sulfurospirillaceae bacterium]|nr:hypothetical protein [Sulfurospirillaceae bacterium]MDD2825632.1 hypothetical protein [Sulfurospirillaceae bacterium]